MGKVKSYYEVRPNEVKPLMHHFAPFEHVRVIRAGWFEWFWIGDSDSDNYKIAIGPFKTRWGARRAWANVPEPCDVGVELGAEVSRPEKLRNLLRKRILK